MRPVALGCLMPHNRSRHWGAPPQARPHPPPCLAPTLCQEFSERINLCMKSKLSLVKDRDFNTSRSQTERNIRLKKKQIVADRVAVLVSI